jgi:hypothetical protein
MSGDAHALSCEFVSFHSRYEQQNALSPERRASTIKGNDRLSWQGHHTMTKLWIANVEMNTTDREITEFLCGYGFPPFDTIERVIGTGRRPAVVLGFDEVAPHALHHLQPRVHAVFWKNRTLTVHVMVERKAS